MEIVKQQEGGALTIALKGRLDTTTSPELEKALDLTGVTELKFDLADLDYVSSAGLRVLLSSQKTMTKQGSMTIANVCPVVREVFDITGFSDIFTIV